MASENSQRRQETSVTDNVTQRDEEVKTKFSRQLLNDAWDDIRDKMYENEVHEDIIGEIETYIKKLTTRKLARETAVTEGLIPKYEAILKVAREYTKGSEVSAQQLADTINDLMWAAHDGNLDTKQFISTVKLIAEDIIRTGSQINDDMYREYEELVSYNKNGYIISDTTVFLLSFAFYIKLFLNYNENYDSHHREKGCYKHCGFHSYLLGC